MNHSVTLSDRYNRVNKPVHDYLPLYRTEVTDKATVKSPERKEYMNIVTNKVRKKQLNRKITKDLFRNEDGAIDLASIMVGIIVIGLIGGVIAATIFAVIPWSQDNAAKQQLDSITSAESAYMGLSAAVPMALPAGSTANSFGNSAQLATASLLQTGPTYCVSTPADSKSYTSFSQSASGNIWSASDKISQPVLFTGTLPSECQFIAVGTAPAGPYVDPTPTRTILTYKCTSNVGSGSTPFSGTITGTETWSDSVGNHTYNGAGSTIARSFTAGVTYTVTFDGTYNAIAFNTSTASAALSYCLRSVDHLGMNTGVTSTASAFSQASNLTSVPDHIPTTITDMNNMFNDAIQINDPNISKWNVSNVTNMNSMFYGAAAFNQPLNSWNTTKVTAMAYMFKTATGFNQPLNNWNTSKVVSMLGMFYGATAFNQPLNNWDVSKVGDMSYMFYSDTNFNQNLSNWTTTNVSQGGSFAPAASFPAANLPPKTSRY